VFYERVQGNNVYNAALNPPFAYQPSATNVYFSDPHNSALTGATTSQSFPSVLTNINYHYPNPGTADYSFGIQRELAPSVVAVVQYVGSDGWDQNDVRSVNTLPLTSLAQREEVATSASILGSLRFSRKKTRRTSTIIRCRRGFALRISMD